MKARIAIIGDYEAESKTYGVGLIADESEVEKSPLKEGDEVEIVLIANAPGQVRRQLSPEPGCSEHDWAEETLHEPNFHVAYGAKRVCRKCGKQFSTRSEKELVFRFLLEYFGYQMDAKGEIKRK
jgi:hypothetical protein